MNLCFDLPFRPLCREDQLILLLLGAPEDPEGPIKHNNRYKKLDTIWLWLTDVVSMDNTIIITSTGQSYIFVSIALFLNSGLVHYGIRCGLTCIPADPASPFSPLILSPGSPYEKFNHVRLIQCMEYDLTGYLQTLLGSLK